MTAPKLDLDNITIELNKIKRTGTLLTNPFMIKKLTAQIDKVDDATTFHLFSASLSCLTGNFELAYNHTMEVLKQPVVAYPSHAVLTLATAGYFLDARRVFDEYIALMSAERFDDDLAILAIPTFSIEYINKILATETDTKLSGTNFSGDVLRVLQLNNIAESTVVEMLDYAGKVMRDHHLYGGNNPSFIPNLKNNTINISIPIKLSPKELVQMEWEFLNTLHLNMPQAPSHAVHVGFTCH
jgi:hypothetical protein